MFPIVYESTRVGGGPKEDIHLTELSNHYILYWQS